jgi:pilus assembly protein Flp/PilA
MTRQPMLLYIATTSAGGYFAPEVGQEYHVRQLVLRFFADQTGATAIEYALIATGISIVILASVNSIGTSVSNKFTPISTALK